jgi:hypothetical protein
VLQAGRSPNPPSRTMDLGSTQPLTEMSTQNLPEGKGRPTRRANNFTAICEPIVVYKIWEPRILTSLWTSMACYMDTFTLFFCLTALRFQVLIMMVTESSVMWPHIDVSEERTASIFRIRK